MAGKQYSLDSRMDLVTTLVQSARPADNMPTMRENSTEGLDLQDTGRQKIKDEVTETKPLPFAVDLSSSYLCLSCFCTSE